MSAKPAPGSRFVSALGLLWASAAVLLLMTWLHVLALDGESRARELATAQRDLSNMTRLTQEHTDRTLRSADQVLHFVQARYLEQGRNLDLAALTRQGVIDTKIFNQVGVIDAQGLYILSNLPIKERIDLSDREHFRVHLNPASNALFVSKPVLGRASGKWSMQLTRRISLPDGRLGGVVVVSIDPGYFAKFYGELNLGPAGLMALYGLDGVARARIVGDKQEFGSDASKSGLFQRLARQELTGTYSQKSVVDGVERLFFFRRMPDYPLAVVSGIDLRFLLNNYTHEHQVLLLQGGIVSLLLMLLTSGMTWHLWSLRRENERRRLAQMQLQDRNDQMDVVFELSPDGFVSFDRAARVHVVNRGFGLMTGLGVPLQGMHANDFSDWLAQLCEPTARFKGVDRLSQGVGADAPGGEQTIELKSPAKRVLQIQSRVSQSASVSQILYFRDITHQTEVELLKSDFLATAAHELRTPMASIYGFAEVLLTQDVDAASQKEFVGIIYRQSKQMVQILNELLDLARIEAGHGRNLQFTRTCLQDLLQELAKSYLLPEGRQAPVMRMPTEPVMVQADQSKLRQALLNVLSNAYKYSPGGGPVEIQLEAPAATGQSAEVVVSVTDHGIGMSPEQAGKIFTPFYRADTSGRVPGTGLG
ncbi:MAG: hypothetical protein HXX19_16295, partial [Rhodoferax sp.]|nr:hypothetical protein [Rhodoferax sp.]